MFGLKKIINWASLILIGLSVYFSLNFYSYQTINEGFVFEGIAIVMFIFMISILETLPINNKFNGAFVLAVIFSSTFLTLNSYLLIPLTLTFLYYFRNNLYLVFGGLIFISLFAFSFNSILLNNDKINITIETLKVIPLFVLIIFITFNFYFGWIIADKQELLFTSGLMIFILLSIAWIYDSPIQNRFLLTIPIFLFSLKNYRVDRFLGKVYN